MSFFNFNFLKYDSVTQIFFSETKNDTIQDLGMRLLQLIHAYNRNDVKNLTWRFEVDWIEIEKLRLLAYVKKFTCRHSNKNRQKTTVRKK